MSGVLAVFAPAGSPTPRETAAAMLERMRRRGADRSEVWQDGAATLGVARSAWEMEAGFSGDVLVAREGGLAAAADATLYYRDDLLRALAAAGVPPTGETASHLILAAYRAWGERCPERLEGDFAFVLWDGERRRLVCGRDFGGKRPLFHAEVGGAVLVASTISAVLVHPRCPAELNLAAIAADAAALLAEPRETCRRAVERVPAGSTLVADERGTRVFPHWTIPPVRDRGGGNFAAGAEELRHLLRRATEERLAPAGPTSVWLSGGWDSTAVFAAGENLLRGRAEGKHLHAISVSYPPGDPGHEDELIEAVVEHWGAPVLWLDIADIPVFDHPLQRAAERDEPLAHAFEMFNRALAGGSRAAGARVAWDGTGGDQLFQVSNVYLADLLRTGRWRSLRREWRAKGMAGSGYRTFFRWAVQPNLPSPILPLATFLRGGRPLRDVLERPFPDWFAPRFLAEHGLRERERRSRLRRTGSSRAAHETRWYLAYAFFPRIFAYVARLALEAGVEIRSPLYDRRIVDFAASRPVAERSLGRETKRLLREAGRGLLPDEVLAPRAKRTGTTGAYFDRALRQRNAEFIDAAFRAPLRLAELGMVDATLLRRRWDDFLRSGEGNLGLNLYLTLQTELWLRARDI